MNINSFVDQLTYAATLMQANLVPALMLVGCLWIIQFVNFILRYRLNILGIYPRHPFGLIGIFFSPLLHGSFTHLFFNSIPLIVLLDFVLAHGMNEFFCVTLIITILGGFLTWVFGRRGLHVGASLLVMGYIGYLLIDAYQHPSVMTLVLGAICLYYFGGFVLQLFPTEERTSWEAHLFGFLAGISSVYICPLVAFYSIVQP